MSRRLRTGIIIALVGVGLAFVGLFVISRVVRQSLAPLPPPTPLPPITEKVVVTTHNIALGAVLQAGDLTQVDVPVDIAPRDAVRDVEAIVGRIARFPLVSGEMVLPHHLADPTNITHDLAFVIGDTQVLMAFPIADLMSELNLLQRGDLVDVLVSIDQPVLPEQVGLALQPEEQQTPQEKLFTFSALQRIEISAVVVEVIADTSRRTASASAAEVTSRLPEGEATPQPTPTPPPSEVRPRALLLALAPQDALVLKHLKDAGGVFDIVLRAPTSTQLFELDPVMSEYLIDRYQLEISR